MRIDSTFMFIVICIAMALCFFSSEIWHCIALGLAKSAECRHRKANEKIFNRDREFVEPENPLPAYNFTPPIDPDEEINLSWEERTTFQKCPVCGAPRGEHCNPDLGIPLGGNINGLPPKEGVHLARLQGAPTRKKMIYLT